MAPRTEPRGASLQVWPAIAEQGVRATTQIFAAGCHLLDQRAPGCLAGLTQAQLATKLAGLGVLGPSGAPMHRTTVSRRLADAQDAGLLDTHYRPTVPALFGPVPVRMVRQLHQHPRLLVAYGVIAYRRWRKEAISQAELAKLLGGLSRRAIRWALSMLEAAGVLRVERRWSQRRQRRLVSKYTPRNPDRAAKTQRAIACRDASAGLDPVREQLLASLSARAGPPREERVAAALQQLRRECEDNNVREDRTRDASDRGIDLETHLRELAEEAVE